MIRLLGAITGSALAIATLLVLVGVPQFRSSGGDADEPPRPPVTLPRPTTPVEAPQALADAAGTDADTLPDDAGETPPAVASTPAAAEPPQADSAAALPAPPVAGPADTTATPPVAGPADTTATPPAAADVQQWYAFWSPFRSEIAASGFVSRLQSVTGLDYRIVKVKTGVYEVAFAYADDDEIIDNLAQISAATGLELAENR